MSERADRRRVAIVGCGVAGLTSIKACLEEGLEPHCFEVNSDLGGVWYIPDPASSRRHGEGARMYDSLVTNSSKSMICFSDFPCPPNYPSYLPHALYVQYMQSYAQHFDLMKHVAFNTKVVEVRKSDDYNETGCWVVTTRKINNNSNCTTDINSGAAKNDGTTDNMNNIPNEDNQTTSATYHGVILCQGFCSIPRIPHIPGLSLQKEGRSFPGRVSHVNSYKDAQPYRGKTVVVVGSGSSAGDVACDIADVAKQVYLVVHRGSYVISRIHKGRKLLDFRLNRMALYYLPSFLLRHVFFSSAAQWLSPATSGLQSSESSPDPWASVMISDRLPAKISTGEVKVVPQIQRVTQTGDLELKDGRVLTGVNDVIFATGYKYSFSIIDQNILTSDPDSGKLELYQMVFPLSLPHDTLGIVGSLRAFGPIPPIIELQARLAARVIAGNHQLPSREVRQHNVDRVNRQQLRDHGFYRYAFLSLTLSDVIASELGVRPSVWGLLLRGEVGMAGRVMLGPALPFHYRLSGPHCWPGAREAIREAIREAVGPPEHIKAKDVDSVKKSHPLTALKHACLLVVVPACCAVFAYLLYST